MRYIGAYFESLFSPDYRYYLVSPRFPQIPARSQVRLWIGRVLPIPNGRVIVHWDSAGLEGIEENIGIKDDKIATTDSAGHFSLELPPGVYDVFVTDPGFSPHCEKLTLKAQEMHRYEVRLKVSRMITIKLD